MEFRLWERIAIVGAAICVILYFFFNIVVYQLNQTRAINTMADVVKGMQGPVDGSSPPNKR